MWHPEPTDLLRTDRPNVFNSGVNGGTQLETDDPLVRGRTYLLLSPRSKPKTPPRPVIRPVYRFEACDPKGDWEGHLLYITARKDEETERWVEHLCRRPVVDPPPRMDIVLPPVRQFSPDGALELDEGQEVVLALSGENWRDPILELTDEESGRSEERRIEVHDSGFITLGPLPSGRFTVHVRDWDYVAVRLAILAASRPVIADVTLRTAPRSGGPEFETSLLSSDATERWANLLSGRESWRRIDVPDNWPISLSWRGKDAREEIRPQLTLPSSLTEALSECLASVPDCAVLDAGPFGRVEWRRPPKAAPPVAKLRALPASLSARLTWVLNAQRATVGPRVPLSLATTAAWPRCLSEPQSRLIAGFIRTPGWSPRLLPLARSVGRELSCWFKQ